VFGRLTSDAFNLVPEFQRCRFCGVVINGSKHPVVLNSRAAITSISRQELLRISWGGGQSACL